MSPLVRQRSRTASSWTVGMRTQTSSPARCNRASRRQSRRSVSGLVARRLGDQRRGDHLAAHVQAVQQPGQLEAGRSGLVAGSQAAGVAEAANEPADGYLVVGNPLDVWDLLVGRQDPDRDGVLVDIQAEMDRREVRDTRHGRLLPYGGSARPGVGDPRRCGPEPAVPCWLRIWRLAVRIPRGALRCQTAVRTSPTGSTLRLGAGSAELGLRAAES
jgi:hypothetical protein